MSALASLGTDPELPLLRRTEPVVLYFDTRDQQLDDASHVEFGRRIGDLTAGHPVWNSGDVPAEVYSLDSTDNGFADVWHTDVTFMPRPPMGSILYWLRPKTIRLPPWPGRVPLTRGDARTPVDVLLYGALLVPNEQQLNQPERFGRIQIPLLSEIPIIGPVLFNQTFIVYLMFVTVAVVAWGLYRTRWGLRLRAVGEHPQAADTVGIKVNTSRFWNVTLAGAIAGIGGAYFTLVSVPQFGKDMTAGLGFIALAAVIFGRWDPIRATLAALLFGFATNLQNLLTVLKTPVPSEFMLMLPYVVTILAVAGFAGQIRGPAASGKPYIKE